MSVRPSLLKVLSLIGGVVIVSAGLIVVCANLIGVLLYKPSRHAPIDTLAVTAADSTLFALPLGDRQVPGGRLALAVADSNIVVDTVGIAGPETANPHTTPRTDAKDSAIAVLLRRVPGHDTTVNGEHGLLFDLPTWFPTLRDLLGNGLLSNIFTSAKARLLIHYHIVGKAPRHATSADTARRTPNDTGGDSLQIDSTGHAAVPYTGRVAILSIEFGNPCWAFTWGILANIIALTLVWGMFVMSKRTSDEWPQNRIGEMLKHMGQFPLRLTRTSSGTYSLAAFQMLIWTVVVFFGMNFVWKMSQGFLEISQQILLLLGIGGGTAVLKHIAYNARLQNVPADQKYLVQQPDDGPGPSIFDLVSEDNSPNIAKIQMLMFTILVAGIAIRYICTDYTFPQLPDGLITLLGLSSAVFVGATAVSGVTADQVKEEAEKLREMPGEEAQPVGDGAFVAQQQPQGEAKEAYRKLLRRYLNV